MGCGGSKNSQPLEHRQQNHQLVTSISNNQFITSVSSSHADDDSGSASDNDHHADTMLRKVKEKSQKSPDTHKTLEQKIRTFTAICEEDANEAVSLAGKHPNLHDDFNLLVNIMHKAVRKDAKQCMQQLAVLLTENSTELISFFTLIGGAAATVEMNSGQLKIVGVTHLTDKLFSDSGLNITQAEALELIHMIRMFWVDATDASLDFARGLAEAKLFPYLTEDLKNLDKSFSPDSDVFDESVTILHNCARNRQLRQYFRDIGAVQLLTPHLARKDKGVKLLTLLTLSHIIDEEENHLLLADNSDFDFLLDIVSLAWSNDDHRAHSGYSLEELLQGLGNLAQNDENKKLLMKKGALVHLKPILEDGSDTEKQEAAKIVWELAFDKENKQAMKEDAELMDLLHKLKDSSHHGVAKSCSGALWVLNMDIKVKQENSVHLKGGPSGDGPLIGDLWHFDGAPPPAPPPPLAAKPGGGLPPAAPPAPSAPLQPGSQGHIMISYQWGHQKMLMQIRNSLRAQGFKVWMDIDNISGSTLQAMAEAVEGSSVVLLCMSQRYKDSPNCRTEAEYAFALQKPIIPLLMERHYKPDGWLGILRGSKLFFDFSGKYPYEKKLDELVKELGQRGRSNVSEVDGPIVAEKVLPVASAPPQGVDSWSQKNVHNWLHKNQLSGCSKLLGLSGENVKFLQKLSQRAPEFYFTYLKQDLGLTSLNDLMHFSDAIDKLP